MPNKNFSAKQKAAVASITSPLAGIMRTAAMFGGGIGGGGGLGGVGGGAGGFLSGLQGIGGGAGATNAGNLGLGIKGFLSDIARQTMVQKNETLNFFRNIRGNEGFKPLDPGAPEDNPVGLNAQDFLRSINQQFGRRARR